MTSTPATSTRIKSLQIIGSKSFGGAERWFQRFSHELAALGHPTELVVRKGYELETADWQGLVSHPLAMHTVWDPLSKWQISRLIKQVRPDIVQTYMGRSTRLTHVTPGRGPVHIARIGGYYKLDGYRHAHAWIGNTKGICDYLLQNGFPRKRIFHIYNFFESQTAGEGIASRRQWGIPEDAWVLMTPGRMIPVKGHKYLLEALRRLPEEIKDRPVRLLMLGDGPLAAELKELSRSLGLNERVVWAGWQADPAPFYRLADMVVFPSLEKETFGNVILEAWAYAKPLVTAGFRGAREIVRNGEDALMVPCENPNALVEGIRRVAEDPDLRQALTEAGHKRLDADFSKQTVMQQYIELYKRLVGQP